MQAANDVSICPIVIESTHTNAVCSGLTSVIRWESRSRIARIISGSFARSLLGTLERCILRSETRLLRPLMKFWISEAVVRSLFRRVFLALISGTLRVEECTSTKRRPGGRLQDNQQTVRRPAIVYVFLPLVHSLCFLIRRLRPQPRLDQSQHPVRP